MDIPVLTIDGPSGSGKGTICALVARELGWHLLDSGALYRLVALGAMRRIHESELTTPGDVSVIGFDDIEFAAQVSPPLTTMSAPIGAIATRACEMLGRLIDGEGIDCRHVSLAARLVVRQSCAQPNIDTVAA